MSGEVIELLVEVDHALTCFGDQPELEPLIVLRTKRKTRLGPFASTAFTAFRSCRLYFLLFSLTHDVPPTEEQIGRFLTNLE
jgi:hypothetical protein